MWHDSDPWPRHPETFEMVFAQLTTRLRNKNVRGLAFDLVDFRKVAALELNPEEMADLTATQNMDEDHKAALQVGVRRVIAIDLQAKNDANTPFDQHDFRKVAALELTPEEMAVLVENMDYPHKRALAFNCVAISLSRVNAFPSRGDNLVLPEKQIQLVRAFEATYGNFEEQEKDVLRAALAPRDHRAAPRDPFANDLIASLNAAFAI